MDYINDSIGIYFGQKYVFEYFHIGEMVAVSIFGLCVYRRLGSIKKILWLKHSGEDKEI